MVRGSEAGLSTQRASTVEAGKDSLDADVGVGNDDGLGANGRLNTRGTRPERGGNLAHRDLCRGHLRVGEMDRGPAFGGIWKVVAELESRWNGCQEGDE